MNNNYEKKEKILYIYNDLFYYIYNLLCFVWKTADKEMVL